jgi:hypothetical protein
MVALLAGFHVGAARGEDTQAKREHCHELSRACRFETRATWPAISGPAKSLDQVAESQGDQNSGFRTFHWRPDLTALSDENALRDLHHAIHKYA